MMVVTPYTLLTVLPFGAYYVANGTLTVSDFVICIILSLVQQGTHEQLMKQEGIYKRFVDARQQAVSWKLAH